MYKMYKVVWEMTNVEKVCDICYERGRLTYPCKRCNGTGTYIAKDSMFVVRPILIVHISRMDKDTQLGCLIDGQTSTEPPTGTLLYWEDEYSFYTEIKKLVHFTEKDAQAECDRRNTEQGIYTLQTAR